ncbi:MAG: hypothetical protein WDN06_03665 [Asticcacaulis sp.]
MSTAVQQLENHMKVQLL